jgi:hypothetical protein
VIAGLGFSAHQYYWVIRCYHCGSDQTSKSEGYSCLKEYNGIVVKLKPKIEVPSGCSTEEFTRLEELVRLLVSVPKKDTKHREKKKARGPVKSIER